jgi:hypothetical protein
MQLNWKTCAYGHHQRTWLQKSMRKVGAEYVHRQTHKIPKNICELLQRNEDDGDAFFLSRAIIGDESRAHHFDPLTKRLSMKWHHQSSPPPPTPKREREEKEEARCKVLRGESHG